MVKKLNRSSCLVKFRWFGIIAQARRVEFTAAKSEGIKSIIQATVVQRLDNAIHWINRYPVDKC